MPEKPAELREAVDMVQLKLRFRERMRARLEASAKANATSLNSEIVARLERSLDEDARAGSWSTRRLLQAFASEIGRMEAYTEKSWATDLATYHAAQEAIHIAFQRFRPRTDEMVRAVKLSIHIVRLETEMELLKEQLKPLGVFSVNLSQLASRPYDLQIEPEERWNISEGQVEEVRTMAVRFSQLKAELIESNVKMDELMEPSREARENGQAIFRVLSTVPENE